MDPKRASAVARLAMEAAAANRALIPVSGARVATLPPSLGKPVERAMHALRRVENMDELGKRSEAPFYQVGMESLAAGLRDYGPTKEYLDFLGLHRVPDESIEKVASGQLDMSQSARWQRAKQLGLDSDLNLWRVQDPGLATTLGRLRNGLQYVSFAPPMSQNAAQRGSVEYPVWGPKWIAGLDPAPKPMALDDLLQRLEAIRHRASHDGWSQFLKGPTDRGIQPLAMSQTSGAVRLPPMKDVSRFLDVSGIPASMDDWEERRLFDWSHNADWGRMPAVHYHSLESEKLSDDLGTEFLGQWKPDSIVHAIKDMGYQGVLVSDEAPRSVAFFGPTASSPAPSIRHRDLSVLDPDQVNVRNMFLSLLPLLAPTAPEGER